jgi:phage tail sheath protein FI
VAQRTISGVSTAVTAFVGTAKDGPVGVPVAIAGDLEYERYFGGLDGQSEMSYAVRQFFLNGGREAIVVRLASWSDGAGLLAAFLGDRGAHQGMYALDSAKTFNLLCLPGISAPSILAAAVDYCVRRRAFLIVDPPPAVQKPDDALAWISGPGAPKTDHGAVYFPWLIVADPLDHDHPRAVPPSGTVAGLYARTDDTRGVWKAPAGTGAYLVDVTTVTQDLTDRDTERLNPRGVNCIRRVPGGRLVCWGARTLLGDDQQASEWKYVPIRRLALYIEESVRRGLEWAAAEPSDEPLWTEIRQQVEVFLLRIFRDGALQGSTPRDAYFVRCDRQTMTASDIAAGIVNVVIGFAPVKPAEFVIVRITLQGATA